MKIILASRSPRRRELLDMLGLDYEAIPAVSEEEKIPGEAPGALVTRLAEHKAGEISEKFPDALVIGSDTVVELDGKILGKPEDAQDAFKMLRALSGRTHRVFTGLALIKGDKTESGFEAASVTFRELTDAEIRAYIATGEPMDKAGAYGAQGLGALLVRKIDGDFFAVMGLPLCRLGEMLASFGVGVLRPKDDICL